MQFRPPTTRRVLLSAVAALTIALGIVSLIAGFSDSTAVRLLQGLAVFGLGAAVLGGAVVVAMIQLAGWRDPTSEQEFEALVQRTEQLANRDEDGEADLEDWDPEDIDDESDYLEDDEDFRALVRSALDELPLAFHQALEHVAVVVSEDGGRRRRAYGLYQGDTVARDHFHDRIVIFKDTLVRDFGHDSDLLKAQVIRTVRHELAHHLGWDERGVRGLGL